MSELYGIEYLRNKLSLRQTRVRLRYKYYEMKDYRPNNVELMPARLRFQYVSTCGWCAKAVDSLADRLCFRGFDNDTAAISDIFRLNNADTFFDSAILSALISSCAFVYISKDDEGYPRLQVIDGYNATGVLDETTGMLKEGYAVLERDKHQKPVIEAYFAPGYTTFYDKRTENEWTITYPSRYPMLVPIIYRPDARRPFGHSRISRTCMYLQRYAKRTLERSEISADFYSFPQKYVLGLSDSADHLDSWKATMTSFLRFDKDEDGDKPTVGSFNTNSMTPYNEQLKMAAGMFAGETGLTLDDLGFSTGNPASAEAIKASHESLRLTARKAQRTFGSGFINVGLIAASLRDDFPYRRDLIADTVAMWEPIFEPDAAMLSSIGDGAIKINQAIPGFFDKDTLRNLTGIDGGEDVGGYSTGASGEASGGVPETI